MTLQHGEAGMAPASNLGTTGVLAESPIATPFSTLSSGAEWPLGHLTEADALSPPLVSAQAGLRCERRH